MLTGVATGVGTTGAVATGAAVGGAGAETVDGPAVPRRNLAAAIASTPALIRAAAAAATSGAILDGAAAAAAATSGAIGIGAGAEPVDGPLYMPELDSPVLIAVLMLAVPRRKLAAAMASTSALIRAAASAIAVGADAEPTDGPPYMSEL